MVVSKMKKPAKGNVLDATKRIKKRRTLESKIKAIADHLSSRRTSREIDLENGGVGFTGGVNILDSVVLKAGRSEFEIVFVGVSSENGLDCLIFENRLLREEKFFKPNEEEKIWGGMLMDGSTFEVKLKRLPSFSDDQAIAQIDLAVKVSRAIVFGE
jgi:hypothetical protein